MSAGDCSAVRSQLGLWALGRLEPDVAAGVAAHLDGCAECRHIARELEAVAELLRHVDVSRLEDRPPLPDGLEQRTMARIRRIRRRRWAAAAAGVAAAAAVALAVLVWPRPPAAVPLVVPAEVRSELGAVDAAVRVEARPWGTALVLEVSGLPPAQPYWVWIRTADGERVVAGTFTAVPGVRMQVPMAAAVPLDRSRAVWVTDAERRTVLWGDLPR